MRPGPHRGVTLIELMVGVAILAILATLAWPSFTSWIERSRLVGAAEVIAQDIIMARSQALNSNKNVVLTFSAGASWCYGLLEGGSTGCDCNVAGSCTLKRVDSSEFNGISLGATALSSSGFYFDPVRSMSSTSGYIQLSTSGGSGLRVQVNAVGRPTVCVNAGAISGYPACS